MKNRGRLSSCDGKPSAETAVDGFVPASAYSKVGSSGTICIRLSALSSSSISPVRSVNGCFYHDDVKFEVSLLSQGTFHGISHRLSRLKTGMRWWTVASYSKSCSPEVGLAVEGGVLSGAHLAQVLGALFHLYLHLAFARVYIVKLLFAALTGVESASE